MTDRINFGLDTTGSTIGDASDAHVITIAPTGAGKNVSSIIPNLLEYSGSVFVIDPKGENAARTYKQRENLGQKIYVLDPFGISGINTSFFNPLDYIDDGEAGITQAERLADTLILESKGDNRHFSDEGRALLKALILHVKTYKAYTSSANLGEINKIAANPTKATEEMLANTAYFGLVMRTAIRINKKEEREKSSVWSTVQANLSQFLDDPRVARNLMRSSFDFSELQTGKISVFIVLPAPYLHTFSRWLRLLVGTALDRLLLNMDEKKKPKIPVLMVLDEFAHLGNLEAVKTAFGLARGAGLRIWAILQSLSQLDDVYGEHGRETLIANSGSLEIFNIVDNHACRYFAEKCGDHYVLVKSLSRGRNLAGVGEGFDEREERRPRLLPIDIANLPLDTKLIFRRGLDYCEVRKVLYYTHKRLKTLAS